MNRKLEGILPAISTVCTEKGEIDEESQRRLMDFLIEKGVHGIMVMIWGGEFYKYSDDERKRVIEIVIDQANGRVPVVAGTSHTGTWPAVKLSKYAEDAGSDAVIVMPPYFSGGLVEATLRLREHYEAISRAIDIPVVVQESGIGIPMNPSLFARLAEENDNIKYVKVEGPGAFENISEIKKLAGNKLCVFSGSAGRFLIQELSIGVDGNVPGSAIPEMCVEPYEEFKRGNIESAKSKHDRFRRFYNFCFSHTLSWNHIEKEILKRRGIITSAHVREPSVPLADIYKRELIEILKDLNLVTD
jgi:4-hydroxy-tetrahydrodipicolinate synthase